MGRSKHLAIAVAISVLDSIVGLLYGVRYGGHGRVISGSAALCPSLFGGHVPCGYIDRPLADGDVGLRYRAST
jgi:hypothetical protein